MSTSQACAFTNIINKLVFTTMKARSTKGKTHAATPHHRISYGMYSNEMKLNANAINISSPHGTLNKTNEVNIARLFRLLGNIEIIRMFVLV